jgi:nitronate monooxygenase
MLKTGLTDLLGIEHPVLLAPMAGVSGAELAASVSAAGGLGLLGGGYCDSAWIRQELDALRGKRFGFGAITWALDQDPNVLDIALSYGPEAVFLSFGDIAPHAGKVRDSEVKLIAQVQTVDGAKYAADQGADIIVAQGTEAGGHGGARATLPLVAAVVDAVPDRPVVAAGGIADGRGLAAALMLGAQGVLVGTAFCAAEESLAKPGAKKIMETASGDRTIRSTVFDIARDKDWPKDWNLRTLRNDFTDRWHDDPAAMLPDVDAIRAAYTSAMDKGEFNEAAIIVGEAIDLVHAVEPAADILQRIVRQAEDRLAGALTFLRTP